MSSAKKLNMCRSEKCNCNVGQCSEDSRGTPKRRNMPPILRLDSTGEVTSHDFGGNRSRGCDRKCHFSQKMNDSFKNIVDYVGAASSSFIDVSTGISKQLTDNRNPFDCVKKILHSCSETSFDFNGNKSEQVMTDTMKKETLPCPQGSPAVGRGQTDNNPFYRNWSNNVLGAFHGYGYKSPCYTLHKQSYTPYLRRTDVWQHKTRQNFNKTETDNAIDPNLKPYNARLLQKSKQCKKDNQVINPKSDHANRTVDDKQEKLTESNSVKIDNDGAKAMVDHEEVGRQSNRTTDGSAQVHVALESNILPVSNDIAAKSPKTFNSIAQVENAKCKLQNGIQEIHSEEKTTNEKEITDWFEYENKDLKTIPIDLHGIEIKCETVDTSPEIDHASVHPSLSSWCSIDFDAESVKCKSEILTQNKPQPADRTQDSAETIQNKADINHCKQNSCDMKKINVKIENLDTSPKSKLKHADIKDSSESESDKSFVLYVRNCKKSSKPSCKKRRRQRAKKECFAEENPRANSASEKNANTSDSKGKENPIAFILGIDTQAYSAGNAQPFLVSCDINSDSDWSDSDNECDESPEETSILDELSMFNLCEDFNPLNFKVTCSVQPTPTESSSHIDAINLSWQVNVCVSSATQNRKPTDKKVHFANEKDLVEVHLETAEWCQDYADARIGPWRQYAADRERFNKRIADSETVLNPILLNGHRDKVYNDRFCED